ncbi:MAG: (Fe-S)-binding protein, partial [Methylophilaceae bacterium]|nr:(Fe-S)-binding protein [Methylophilaceae bacterium]
WKRFKVLGYASALILMTSILFYNIGTQSDTVVNVQQVRQPLFVMLSDGSIRNRYQIHIVNKTEADQTYQVTVKNIPAEALDMGNIPEIRVRAGKALAVNAKINLSHELAEKTHEFEFEVTQLSTGEKMEIEASFNAPKE